MALALTKAIAYGVEVEEPRNKRYRQHLVLEGTGAGADVTYDIGDTAGTFWTAVGGTQPGTAALAALKDIVKRAKACLGIEGPQLWDRVQVAALTAAGQKLISADATTGVPKVSFNAADGETAFQLVISWYLKDGQEPVQVYADSTTQSGAA